MLLLDPFITVADFIVALEEKEVKELSDLDDPCGTNIDATKIQYAIDRATEEINSYFVVSGNCGRALVYLNGKNLTIAIARYLLDTLKNRPAVTEAYERALDRLKDFSIWDDERNCPLSDDQLAEILGDPPPSVDDNFRFGSSKRRWTDCNFDNFTNRLIDSRGIGTSERRINKTYPSDNIG